MPERHRILIVDDNAEDRRAVVEALRLDGAEIDVVEADVLEVDTITAAREAIGREEFSCVFLDHDLPDGTALDLLMEVRAQGLVTPVVVLTGRRDVQTITEVMLAGAVDYLPKEKLAPDLIARSLRAALLFHQAQREKQAVLDEMRARDRAIAAAPNGIVITDPGQPDGPIVYVNEAFLRMTGYTEAEVMGRNCRFLQGEGTDPAAVQELREAVRQERPCRVSLLNYRRDGTTFFNEVTVSPVRDARGTLTHFVGVQGDVTARHVADRERGQAAEELRRSREDLRLAIEAAHLGTFYCDFPLDKIVWNDTCKEHFFLPPDAEVDFALFYTLLHPDDREPARQAIERAMAERGEYDVEYRTLAADGRTRWVNAVGRFHYGPDGTPTRFDGITIDITARKRHEVRERARLEDIFMRAPAFMATLRGPHHVFEMVNPPFSQMVGHRDILGKPVAEAIPEVVGQGFLSLLDHVYQSGEAFIGKDIRILLQVAPGGPQEERFLDFAYQPLHGEDGGVSGILAHGIDLTERKRLEIEQERLLGEARARAEREALLNRIGASIRRAETPESVLETAVRELGLALGVDRCYYAAYDQDADTATLGPDWHRAGLPNLAGQYPMSRYVVNRDPVYKAGRTQAVADTGGDPAILELGVRALIRVPLVSGTAMTALSVAMAGGPRDWTPEEVSLVEAVATQTQTALEAVRVQRREHQIAEQLQAALQPALPEYVPGLSLGHLTEPALAEAEVGGDFYDVFPLDKEQYALVIGDVSGKGLAAAQQLALIRNTLRAMLYLDRKPAQAAAALNGIVTAHDLLAGFVTAFVAIYDAGTGEIAYCSCGHEPGLVRRGHGAVEALETTGPPLGVAENADYGQLTLTLRPGDSLLLYTDGISEAGPSRAQMLGTHGLMRLFGALPTGTDVQAEVESLVAEVSAYANGVFRDDVAVVLARRG